MNSSIAAAIDGWFKNRELLYVFFIVLTISGSPERKILTAYIFEVTILFLEYLVAFRTIA